MRSTLFRWIVGGIPLAVLIFTVLTASGADAPPPAALAPVPVAQAAGKMTVPEGFKVTLFAGEPDIVQPIAMTFDDRGRLWVAEANTYPNWKFDAKPDTQGKDRLLILEDTDGDGKFDKKTVFKDDLVNLSGFEIGFGGVYVCSAPNLLFIPVIPGQDKPAGPPVALLDGWNIKGAEHNVFNGLTWGPDGWLWGLNGIQSKSAIGKPGTPDEQRVKFDCGVWRYHPTRHTFEVVMWGTTNPWGLDFDEYGQGFITNCVIKHLWHVIPGAHVQRMYGQDPVPNTYAAMESCADHIHWGGGSWTESRSGQGKHSEAGGGHAHVGAMVYLGDNWPDAYRNSLFTCNLHGNRVNNDLLAPAGSGYVAHHGKDFLFANDAWFRGISVLYGPDGGVYVSDWCDTGECHNHKVVDAGNGRIYKVTYGQPTPAHPNLAAASDSELIGLQLHKNEWFVRHARRLLEERAAAHTLGETVQPQLTAMLAGGKVQQTLRAMWALHAIGAMDEKQQLELMSHPEPYVRAWGIRFACDDGKPSDAVVTRLAALGKSDPSPVVRLALASALQRVPVANRWDLAAALAGHGEDAGDQNLPLMIWYGTEPLVIADPGKAMALLANAKLPVVRDYIARRAAGDGTGGQLAPLVALLGRTADAGVQRDVLRGMFEALEGQRHVPMPEGWAAVYAKLVQESAKDVGDTATVLALIFGDRTAFDVLRTAATDPKQDPARRAGALQALANAKDPQLTPMLHDLLSDSAIRGAAVRMLAGAGDDTTPTTILKLYPTMSDADRRDAVSTLSSRKGYALALLDAIEKGTVPRRDVSAVAVRQLGGLKDKQVTDRVEKVWGISRPTAKDKADAIQRYKKELAPDRLAHADLAQGRLLFTGICGQCHTLFGEGGKVGPDLTGSQRANLDYLVENVVDPNAIVARDFQMVIVDTKDGRTITGIVIADGEKAVTIRTTNEDLTIPKSEIDTRRTSQISMMPEGLLDALKEDERRNLVAYIQGPSQVALPK